MLIPEGFAHSRTTRGNPTQKALLWKPCLADQQGPVRGLQDAEAGWDRASSETAPRQAPFLGTPLSFPGYFHFRSPPAGEPQADKTCHLKGLLESSRNGSWLLGMNFGFGGHSGVKLRDLFYGLRKEEEKTSLAQLSHHCREWQKDTESCLVQLLWAGWIKKPQPNRNTQLLLSWWGEGGRKGGAGSGNLFGVLKWNSSTHRVSQLTTCFHLVKKTEATTQARILCCLWLLLDKTSKSNKKKSSFICNISPFPREIQSSSSFKATT